MRIVLYNDFKTRLVFLHTFCKTGSRATVLQLRLKHNMLYLLHHFHNCNVFLLYREPDDKIYMFLSKPKSAPHRHYSPSQLETEVETQVNTEIHSWAQVKTEIHSWTQVNPEIHSWAQVNPEIHTLTQVNTEIHSWIR